MTHSLVSSFSFGARSAPALLAVSLALSGATAYAAQGPLWVRQFGTGAADSVNAATPDGAGGVYLTGDTWGSFGGPVAGRSDVWLARHAADGTRLWIRQLGTPESDYGYDIARGSGGGVFVCGTTLASLGGPNAGLFDSFVAHYNADGDQQWIRQFGSPFSEGATVAVADSADGVFVAGSTRGDVGGPNNGENDVWLARYDGAGVQLWSRQFGTTEDNLCHAGAPDGAGGFYLAGDTYPAASGGLQYPDAWVARFNADGAMLWMRQLGTSLPDSARAVATDMAGGVYVTGATYSALAGPQNGELDAWVARYDAAGNLLWSRQLGTPASDRVFSAASDGSGGCFIAGQTEGALGGPQLGEADIWFARFDADGTQRALVQFGSPRDETSPAASEDGAGGLFLGGTTRGVLGAGSAGFYDAWLARFDGLEAVTYCAQTAANSTGATASLTARGSALTGVNDLVLTAAELPQHTLGLFLASRTQGVTTQPGGSQGDLCVAGSIGRFLAPGQVSSSGTAGTLTLTVDLTALPTPTGPVAAQPGETWNFQAWHRDANPGPTSNFTDAVAIRLR